MICPTFQFNMLRIRLYLKGDISPIFRCTEAWRLAMSRKDDQQGSLKLKPHSVVERLVLPLLFLPICYLKRFQNMWF